MRFARILLFAFAGALGSEACAGKLTAHHAYLFFFWVKDSA